MMILAHKMKYISIFIVCFLFGCFEKGVDVVSLQDPPNHNPRIENYDNVYFQVLASGNGWHGNRIYVKPDTNIFIINNLNDMLLYYPRNLPLLNVDFTHESVLFVSNGKKGTTGYYLNADSIYINSFVTHIKLNDYSCGYIQNTAISEPYVFIKVPNTILSNPISLVTHTKPECISYDSVVYRESSMRLGLPTTKTSSGPIYNENEIISIDTVYSVNNANKSVHFIYKYYYLNRDNTL